MPKKLKFVQKGYETYSGPIGKFTFVNGVSTEAIHRVDRDTLSTAFQFVELDDDGVETPAGVAHRLVADSAARAVYAGPLKRQTEAERTVENTTLQASKGKAPDVLHTRAELETIAEKHGIKGLREQVADKWGVRNRSISLLIEEILAAQAKVLEKRQARITAANETPAAPVTQPAVQATVELGADDAALEAAASGDMSAALNQSNTDAEPDLEEPAVDPAAEPADSPAADAAGDEGADAPAGSGAEDGTSEEPEAAVGGEAEASDAGTGAAADLDKDQ
jgi:hypothetical protein